MMLKEATIKNLELEMYERRLNDVKIEMEKTRRRMVAVRAIDYKRKKELKGKNLRLRMSQARALHVVVSRAKWRAKALARNVISSCLKRQLLRTQNLSLFHGGTYKASVRQCAYHLMSYRTSANKVGQHIVYGANAFGIHVTRFPCRRTFDRWRVQGGEWAKECAALAFPQAKKSSFLLIHGTYLLRRMPSKVEETRLWASHALFLLLLRFRHWLLFL